MKRVAIGLCLAVCTAACGGKEGSPTSPTPSPTPTASKIIAISGDLSFGDVLVGQRASRPIQIRNSGTAPLTVSGMSGPGGAFSASWTQGQIAAGGSQDVTINFAPNEARSFVGVITVSADQTSGQNTIPVNARGVLPLFEKRGSGNAVFDMPTSVRRVRIYGHWSGRGTSNFIVHVGGDHIVNAILRDKNPYEGVHQVLGGVVEIVSSENIDDWRFTEER
jgi:Abnormal spindle-like microcephaly-assoc'd, ASPM-SPD-2-Hydin